MVSLLIIISELISSLWRVISKGEEGEEKEEKGEVCTSFGYNFSKKKENLKYQDYLDPVLLTHCSSRSEWILRRMQDFIVAQSKVAKRLGSLDRPLKINFFYSIILTAKNTILNKR